MKLTKVLALLSVLIISASCKLKYDRTPVETAPAEKQETSQASVTKGVIDSVKNTRKLMNEIMGIKEAVTDPSSTVTGATDISDTATGPVDTSGTASGSTDLSETTSTGIKQVTDEEMKILAERVKAIEASLEGGLKPEKKELSQEQVALVLEVLKLVDAEKYMSDNSKELVKKALKHDRREVFQSLADINDSIDNMKRVGAIEEKLFERELEKSNK